MGLFDQIKAMFQSDRLDVSSRFTLDRQAFSGTMSKFRVAKEIATGKTVGIKFLDEEKRQAFEDRFKGLKKPSEGEIAMKISHPLIVETFEHGETTTGQQYIVMEYIEGSGLNMLVQNRDERLAGKRLNLIRQMAESIQAVHDANFIHRDICPRNFICAPDLDSLKMIDFGLTVPDEKEYRMPGNRTGTPLYMAPEIVRRRPTDRRVDLFAFGVTVYRLCAFEHPWATGETTGKAALAHDTAPPTDIREYRPKLNATLADAIMKCLQAVPDQRPASLEDFLNIIRRVDDEEGK